MAKRISPAAIGMFVVGGLALIVSAIVILGSGRLLRKEHKAICFFRGNVNGLKVGSPVKVRGVQIGEVTQILLGLPSSWGILKERRTIALPVIIDVDESQLRRQGGTGEALRPGELDRFIKRGLRGQLSMESILTGMLYIDLDFHPGTPVYLEFEPGTAKYPEIPTIPTNLEQVQETAMRALAKLDKIDFEALARSMADLTHSITNAANSANQLLSSPDLKATVAAFRDTAATLDKTFVSFDHELAAFNAKTDPLVASVKKTADQADLALAQTKSTMADLQAAIAPDSTLRYRLDAALDNMAEASNAIRQLADYLHRNPSALVRGRYVPNNQR